MVGADIYDRYQDVTDWSALSRAVDWLWVKGTDGGGRAPTRADGFVLGARRHAIPVGLYHYAQLVPSPEAQADVLAAEVRRLGATQVAPALDIEAPHRPGAFAREFARRFLRRLVDHHGFRRVAIYGNSTMLAAIQPHTLGIPGLVIWCADYGLNDGKRYPDVRPYTGRVDVHQYTSRGRLPGIRGDVDLNHALTGIPLLTEEDVLSALTDGEQREIYDRVHAYLNSQNVETLTIVRRIEAKVGALSDDEANIIAALRAKSDNLTPEEQAAIIRDQLDGSVLRALRTLLTEDQAPEEAQA
ncbi:glycoside hydrolase family 25 protein [Actinokineospora sp. UTMC 2448]|uniref:glycoside hydrolase family 25 protein n=1 Tax=Actinokineospora sp. UTMC 2448 TaxID=2268449 RepID=UPI0021646C2D|nr:glycoside hydrolase family 25 protein [Actinokineospora sp. UTMC 2448]UVS81855.1 Lyzozyme M1 (1,4-beta-N-acetylmuramidase) [Actinokineospora sp. UTMC 2448]